jgi:hypothetical protein
MLTTARGARGRSSLLAVSVLSAVLLTACGGSDESDTAAATSSGAESSSGESSAAEEDLADLASGLLTADAFGPEASVVAISPEQLGQAAGLAADAGDIQITPKECSAAVAGTQPQFDDFDGVAAQVASSGSAATVEVLVRGGPTQDAVTQLAEAAERCPTAQISSPEIGEATVTFESLPVADLGDGSALLRYTTSLALPDGSQATIPTLIGAVEDGDRLLILMNLDTGAAAGAAPGPPQDPAAFADLLEQAYEAQAAALD